MKSTFVVRKRRGAPNGRMIRRFSVGLGIVALVAGGAGCGSVLTEHYPPKERDTDLAIDKDNKQKFKGLVYYLPTARIKLTLTDDPKRTPRIQVVTTGTVPYPDTDQALLLQYKAALSADEHFCVTRSKTGLLEGVALDSADRSGDIIVKIAETVRAATLLASGGGFGAGRMMRMAKRDEAVAREPLEIIFNPCNDPEVETAQMKIKEWLGDDYSVEFAKLKNLCAKRTAAIDRCRFGSICYRTYTQVLFELVVNEAKKERRTEYSILADFPDLQNVGLIDIEQTMFTRTVTSLGFKEGVLTSFSVSRPSPAYEVARTPLRIISAVMDVPVDFFNKITRGFQSQASANIAAAELIRAQADLVRAQKDPVPLENRGEGGGTQHAGTLGSDPSPPAAFRSETVCLAGSEGGSPRRNPAGEQPSPEKSKEEGPPKPAPVPGPVPSGR